MNESIWVERKEDFETYSNKESPININYNSNKSSQKNFVGRLAINVDNVLSRCNSV